MAGADFVALVDDLLGDTRRRADDELLVANAEGMRGRRVENRRAVWQVDPWVSPQTVASDPGALRDHLTVLAVVLDDRDLAPDTEIVRASRAAECGALVAIGVEDLQDFALWMEARYRCALRVAPPCAPRTC